MKYKLTESILTEAWDASTVAKFASSYGTNIPGGGHIQVHKTGSTFKVDVKAGSHSPSPTHDASFQGSAEEVAHQVNKLLGLH